MKLKKIHEEIHVNTNPEKMWEVLSQYGDVSKFHAGVMESHNIEGSDNQASLGCERVCNIVDMGLRIQLLERIVEYEEGYSYKYEVYKWKNFPIRTMLFGFAILSGGHASTRLSLDIEYRAKPAILTPLLAGKMRKLARDVLLGYKHYAETGEKRVPIRQLKKKYRDSNNGVTGMQYG